MQLMRQFEDKLEKCTVDKSQTHGTRRCTVERSQAFEKERERWGVGGMVIAINESGSPALYSTHRTTLEDVKNNSSAVVLKHKLKWTMNAPQDLTSEIAEKFSDKRV